MDRRQIALMVGLVIGTIGCGDSPTQPGPGAFSGVVANGELHLTLPLVDRAVWQWDQAGAIDGALEYKWTGILTNAGEEYEVGFFKWKFPGGSPQSGTFEQLLQNGQASIFRLDPNGGPSTVVPGPVAAFRDADNVVIRVNDPASLALLTSQSPSDVNLTRTERGQATLNQTVQIDYVP